MRWSVPPIWEGGDVWILGGGSSVPKQFGIPDEVVAEVVKGISPPSIYSPYMSILHDKHVIGINVSYLIGDWIDMCFFGDGGFFQRNKEKLAIWPGLKVSCAPSTDKAPWVKSLMRDSKHPRGISPNPTAVSWNSNSGGAAISVAANAGAKRIILLGFDMNLGNDGKRHWHNLYKKNVVPIPVKNRQVRGIPPHLPFGRHLLGFPYIARDAKARNIEIINCSPDSAIKDFPKYTLKELLIDNT